MGDYYRVDQRLTGEYRRAKYEVKRERERERNRRE